MNFVTPITKSPLLQKDYETLACQESGVEYKRINGIWRMIAAERLSLFEQFMREYETIRLAEGRKSNDKTFYQQLPTTVSNHPAAAMWRQRSHSYQVFLDSVLSKMESNSKNRLDILDLGAGNGWLSNRLAERGHTVTAVDLTINEFDGLGLHNIYKNPFTVVQAEFDHLPFENEQFNLVIFNASLHYSSDYTQTLTESLRVSHQDGSVSIIDTPLYRQAESGRQMVAEREARFKKAYGFKSNSLQSKNFLTTGQIKQLETAVGRQCQTIPTVPSFRQTVRRLKMQLRGQRKAAQFPILLFSKEGKTGGRQ